MKLIAYGLILGVILGGCAKQGESSSTSTSSSSTYIQEFYPASGSRTSLPSQVEVYFTQDMDQSSVQSISNWNFTCDGTRYAVENVEYYDAATYLVNLPSPSFGSGSSCSLTASSSITDASGDALSSSGTVTYTYYYDSSSSDDSTEEDSDTADTTDPTGSISYPYDGDRVFGDVTIQSTASDSENSISYVTYYLDGTQIGTASTSPYSVTLTSSYYANGTHTLTMSATDASGNVATVDTQTLYIQNNSLSSTSSIGGSGGTYFSAAAPTGYNLSGLRVRTGSLVDNIQMIWGTAWGALSYSYSTAYGGTGGTQRDLTCSSGYKVWGIYGYAGSKVDSIGIICKNNAGATQYTSSYGDTGGSYYQLSCPANTFVTKVVGQSGSKVDQLQLYCQ